MKKKIKNKRRMEGLVVSDKMQKTAVVSVQSHKVHPVYKKHYNVSKKYKAHDPEKKYKEGDRVIIEETRPLSKDKKWVVVGKA